MTAKLRTRARKILSRESYSKVATSVKSHLPKIDKTSILFGCSMAIVIVIAVTVRILPYRWSFSLSEFDSYYHYYLTDHIAHNGLFSWWDWHMTDNWYPQGRDVAYMALPGFSMTGAVFYLLISFLGFNLSVMDTCIIFPVVFAAITCIITYYLGKEVGGKTVGLLASLFLAISAAYISRTTLGFYKDETVGVFAIVLASLFYLRSLKPKKKWNVSMAYAIGAGLLTGYLFSASGEAQYFIGLMALSTFLIFIAKKYSRRLLISYGTIVAIGLFVAVEVPKLSFSYITTLQSVVAIGVFLLLAVYEMSQHVSEQRRRTFLALSIAGLGIVALILGGLNIISLPIGKFLSTLNPFTRTSNPIFISVQEHQPATWTSFYFQFGALVFFIPLGVILALQRININKIFIITYTLTMVYFSASLIRLTVPAAPALCIIGAFAIVEILKSITDIATRRAYTRRRYRLYPTMGRTFSALVIIVLFTVTFIPLTRGIDSGDSPTTITSSSLPVRANVDDWTQTLTWMKQNLPNNAVVVSWWDYGYWITVAANKTTLSDNGTFNTTQIAYVGRFFMSTENDAMTMVNAFNNYAKNEFNATDQLSHVVVFTTLRLASQQPNALFGDEVKWRWMAEIGWSNTEADTALADTSITSQLASAFIQQNPSASSSLLSWYEAFSNYSLPKADRVLTKLMVYGSFGIYQPQRFQLIFSSSDGFVFVYKIIYPSIVLDFTSSSVGSTITISGSGFASNSSLAASVGGLDVALNGTTSTDVSGSFLGATFTIPTLVAGSYPVIVTDASGGPSASANLIIL